MLFDVSYTSKSAIGCRLIFWRLPIGTTNFDSEIVITTTTIFYQDTLMSLGNLLLAVLRIFEIAEQVVQRFGGGGMGKHHILKSLISYATDHC